MIAASAFGRLDGNLARIRRLAKRRGLIGTCRFLASRVFRHEERLVFERDCNVGVAPQWKRGEQLLEIGPENIDRAMTPALLKFLGGDEAFESLEGVRNGDRLFVVTGDGEYLHRGYVIFKNRQKRVLGDNSNAPVIGYCATTPAARGRGLYRRTLQAEVSYLGGLGHNRVLIETTPENRASRKGIEAAGFTLAWSANMWIILNTFVLRRTENHSGRNWRAVFV